MSTRARRMRATLPRALRSQLLRLSRSPIAAVHAACGTAAGAACGAYFACAPWDPSLGADAYAQLLGAMMPLMAGIVCGLAVDEERVAGGSGASHGRLHRGDSGGTVCLNTAGCGSLSRGR